MREGEAKVRISIRSRPENIELLALAAGATMRHLGVAPTSLEPAVMALREAVANGVLHGNRRRPEKTVEVALWVSGGQAVIAVRDEGRGFDPGAVPDPRAPENLLKAHGRGIFLMRRMMDDVHFRFNGTGTEVVMRKSLPADGGALAAGAE